MKTILNSFIFICFLTELCCLKDNIDREDIICRFCLYVNIHMYFEVGNIKRLALQVKKTTSSSRASAAGL